MAYEDRSYSGSAVTTTLTASITDSSTTIPIAASTGWPDGTGGPFHVQVDSEVIRCSGRTGLTLNVQTVPVSGRGWDGTTAATHLQNAVIQHVFTATDADEANQHIANTGLDHHTQYLTVARHDVGARHGIGILPTAGTPSTSSVGDTAQTGTSNNVSLNDHRHARESFATPVDTASALAAGSATTIPRSDHVHRYSPFAVTSGTRPTTNWQGQMIVETDTGHVRVRNAAGDWLLMGNYSTSGMRRWEISRTNQSIPVAGTPTLIAWDAETTDTSGFIVANSVNTDVNIPAPVEYSGLWGLTIVGSWASWFSERSFVQINHDGNAYRESTTGDDIFSKSIILYSGAGAGISVSAWQNTAAPVNISLEFSGFFIHP